MTDSTQRSEAPGAARGTSVGAPGVDPADEQGQGEDVFSTLARTTAHVGFWSWDFATGRVWYSREVHALHGVAPGALGDRPDDYFAFVHPDDRTRVRESVWSTASSAVPVEYRFIHPDGGVHRLVARASLICDRAGHAQRLVGTVQDVTDIAIARRTVAEAVTRLAAYFEEMPTPAYLWRREGEGLYLRRFNKAARARWGDRVETLEGMSADEICGDRPDIIADIETCMRTQRAITRETYFDSDMLGRRPMTFTYVPVASDSVVVHAEDVSELQAVSKQAQRATAQLAEYFARVPTPAYLWREKDGDLVLEAANRAGIQATGGRIREGIGMKATEMYADQPEVVADLRRALAGETFTREMYYETFYDKVPLELVVTYVHIPPDAVAAHTRDVTQQRLMEAALRESHEAARGVLDACTQPIVVCDVDGTVLAANDAAMSLANSDPDEYLGGCAYDFMHPDTVEGRRAAIAEVVRTRHPATLEDREGERYFKARLYPLTTESGEVDRVVIYAEDVTEERRAERAIRQRERELTTIMERNPDGICLIVDGRISVCNGALAALMGCSKEKLVGRALHDLMIPGDRERARVRGQRLLDGQPAEPREYTLMRCGGGRVTVEIFGAALDFRGQPALICALRDVEKRKRAERELAESHEALRALTQHLETVREQERAQVARDLHDELGSVLTALKIDLGELETEGVDTAEREELLAAMSERLDQAIEVGRRVTSRLRPGILDDLGLAAAAEWLGADLEKRTGIECRVVLPKTEPELPEPVATAMFRILQEALTNVIRHAEAEAVEVVLDADESSVSLTVSDNGRGFDTAADVGVGFGLLGMRERVRAFDGRFGVDSAPGRGTTIGVTLPLDARD